MREILFKAKRVDNGEWIEGALIQVDDSEDFFYIMPRYNLASSLSPLALVQICAKKVSPETLCQFTGLFDKNGKRIWENDIVTTQPLNEIAVGYKHNYIGKVIYTSEDVGSCGCCYPRFKGCGFVLEAEYERLQLGEKCEVVGNIFDNSELLAER